MQKIYLSILIILLTVFGTTVNGQKTYPHIHDSHCATMEIDAYNRQKYPERGTLEEFERWLAPLVDAYKKQQSNGYRAPLLTIPVVFHIITDGAGAENLTAAQVQAQIDQLNIDYRNLAGSSHAAAADVEVQFCLATLDPNNNPMAEPGINRVTAYGEGPFTSNYVDNTIKTGTSWDPNNYMNIWSANISGGLLGWAQFPDNSGLAGLNANGGAANTDGVVILASSVGSVANPNPAGGNYARGRTLTHEVGHWLGLRHIWGDGACGVDDFCGDTPGSDAANYGCPTGHSSCGSVDMIENYMDYTDDACMNIFTADQKARVRTVMTVSPRRASLANSTKCATPAPMIGFVSGGGTVVNEGTDCGFQDITLDLTISMAPSADATVTFTTSGTATNGLDYDINPASVVFPAGATPTRQVRIRIYNDGIVEGLEDILMAFNITTTGDAIATTGDLVDHDLTIISDDIAPATNRTVRLLSQDFETGIAPFTTQGNNTSDLFLVASTAGANSGFWNINSTNATQFAYSNDDNCNCDKANDRLTSPVFSLAGAAYTSATLTFDHAFANRNGEVGEVQISTGGAYTTIATLTNTSVAGGGGLVTTPWVNGTTVNLTPYIGQATVQIRFRYNDGGTWQYGLAVDNVVVSAEAPTNIQVTNNTALPQRIPVGGMETVHYYDKNTNNVMGTIQNLSTWDYQCTRVEIDRDAAALGLGTATAPFWDNNPANALAAKTFFVAPNNNTPTGSYTITLYYTEAEIAAWEAATGKNRTALKIVKVANTPIAAVNAGNYTAYTIEQVAATLGSFGTDITLTATFNSGFSGFGIGDIGPSPVTLLPMDLLAFNAKRVNKNIQLDWITQNEVDVAHYTLEKSIDGVNFKTILEQVATGNGRSKDNAYNYLDQQPHVGINYYRLGQVDLDGTQTFSKIVAVRFEADQQPIMTIAPNPAYNHLTVDYDSPQKGLLMVEIYDLVGKKMLSESNLSVNDGGNKILLNVKDYPKGIYVLRVKQGNYATTRRFVKR
ncbi:M43 family zinc metalloprotease [Aureispira anguillae]|uniref:M43 family zinc metalloprotease n=1 Tax=Aureispira anguillae TaxID=2864201 RepID=A0A915YF74_9BACT|nr:M43 family zinc metalloprotease [Aureispira anguillae]BDS12017.1 M43 family zinc metalloprotease [Aureispira anguillae]